MIGKRLRGRPMLANVEELLYYEHVWTQTFQGLRDGSSETQEDVPGGYGATMLIRSTRPEQERLQVFKPGKKLREFRADKILFRIFGDEPREFWAHEIPAKRQEWQDRVRKEEQEFNALETGQEKASVRYPKIPGEPHLWEALKRARSAAEVRRICSRSKHWLKWERQGKWKDSTGRERHWYRQSPCACPKALHDHAGEFCRALRDDRYPGGGKQNRPSSDNKRIEYLARVMAGLSLLRPISPATADDLLRKMKPSTHRKLECAQA